MGSVVSVEEVAGGKGRARFTELPHALDGHDPRFAPLVLTWERYRLDPHRNPFFEAGDGRYFLARSAGQPVGRITAHIAAPGGEGRFGFWWVADAGAASALLDAARGWLVEQGCTSMRGPVSFSEDVEAGVLVDGFDAPGLTGRPWHPPRLSELLEANGLVAVSHRSTWRSAPVAEGVDREVSPDAPGQAGAYRDPRLVLEGVAAVPDLSPVLRSTGLRGAWSLARRARERRWETATVVRSTLVPSDAHAAISTAAARAGYQWIVTPWAPPNDPEAAPETTHAVYEQPL